MPLAPKTGSLVLLANPALRIVLLAEFPTQVSALMIADAVEMLDGLRQRDVGSSTGSGSHHRAHMATPHHTIAQSPPPVSRPSDTSSPDESAHNSPALQIGELLGGKYEVQSLIGSGGFSRVYRAMHREMERAVAIKVLDLNRAARFASAASILDLQNRFSREAKFASKLAHTNTLTVFDFGVDTGRWYLVTELVDGSDVFRRVRDEGPVEPRRAAQIAIDVLGSLEEAHHLGILHRDLKTSNVMLTTDFGGREIAKVVDFGMATVHGVDARQVDTPELHATQMGLFIGTPQYAAPEQFLAEQLTPATDIYAVGLILWEMLVGEPAVNVESFGDCLQVHVSKKPWEWPDGADAPEELAQIVLRALAKDPAERYQGAPSMRDDLDAWLDGRRPSLVEGDDDASAEGWSPALDYAMPGSELGSDARSMVDPNVSDELPDLLREDSVAFEADAESKPDSESSGDDEFDGARPATLPAPPPPAEAGLEIDRSALQQGRRAGRTDRGQAPVLPTPGVAVTDDNVIRALGGVALLAAAALVIATLVPADEHSPAEEEEEPPAEIVETPPDPPEPPRTPPSVKRFTTSEILAAVEDLGWAARRSQQAAVTESGSQQTYTLRRGRSTLQLQVVETTGPERANAMASDTRPPAAAVVLDNYLVRVFSRDGADKRQVLEVAGHLSRYRDTVIGPGTPPPAP